MQAPGRILLLVTGIILIIGGVFAVISGVFLDMVGQALDGLGGVVGVQDAGAGFGNLAFIAVILGVIDFVIGVIGITYRNNLDKSTLLMSLGFVALILYVVGGVITGAFTFTTIVFLAIPICYIVGAYKNKKASA